MWFFFGIFTLIAATFWDLSMRLSVAWRGMPERIGDKLFSIQEHRTKERIVFVRLGAEAPAGLHFSVRAEDSRDRFFKRLGVCTEIQAGDAVFDHKLYVESDARAVAILLKRNAGLRSALIKIFACAEARHLRRMRLHCVKKRIWLQFSPKDNDDWLKAKTYLAPLLQAISADLGCIDIPTWYRGDRFVWNAAAALAFSTGTLMLGVFGITRSWVGRTDILEPLWLFAACLIPALLLIAAGTAGLVRLLAASSRAHTVMLECALTGGLGLLLGTYALVREANMDFDFHPATRIVTSVQVVERVILRGRRGGKIRAYYLYCQDWREGHEDTWVHIKISSSMYWQLLGPDSSAALYIKPGLLGFDWVEKIERVR